MDEDGERLDKKHSRRKQNILMYVVPQLLGLLPHDAGVELTLEWGIAECLFGRPGSHGPGFMRQYWTTMATKLRHLSVTFEAEITEDISSALSQLSNLRSLELCRCRIGFIDGELHEAHIRLHLPMLDSVLLGAFVDATVLLDCPKLAHLYLEHLFPLQALSGMPCDLQTLTLRHLGPGSVPLETIFASQSLGKLRELDIDECPGDPGNVSTCCFSSNLTRLCTCCDVGVLFPTQAPWTGLLLSLRHLHIRMPMNFGIPLVLEQLTNLEVLDISTPTGETPMHLDRPLDALLSLPRLKKLAFHGDYRYTGPMDIRVVPESLPYSNWTAPALVLLGLAQKRILDMQRAPGGRKVELCY